MGRPPGRQTGITLGYCDTETGQRVYPAPPGDLLPEQVPPNQGHIEPPRNTQKDKMFANITSWPPLSQATVLSKGHSKVTFSVLLETDEHSKSTEQEVSICLWHNKDSKHDWSETALEKTATTTDTLLLNADRRHVRHHFSHTIDLKSSSGRTIAFTIKFKTSSNSGWKWIRDQTGAADGQIVVPGPFKEHDLSQFFDGVDGRLHITTPRCECPDTLLYSLTAPAKPASGEDSGYSQLRLGLPKEMIRWFSLVRLWAPWLSPRQGSGKFELDKDGVLLSFLREDGFHVVVLGISGVRDVTTLFKHDQDGNVLIEARNDLEEESTLRVLVAVADSFEVANSAVMYEARRIVTDNPATSKELEEEFKALAKPPQPTWFEDWYDGFTYCTWNALGQKLTEDKVLHALDDLQKSGIIIENLIIDDNWQSNSEGDSQFQRGWMEFEANKEGFPRGLKETVTTIRKKYPYLKHISVWHAMMGYWGGTSPDGKIAKEYATTTVNVDMSVIDGSRTVVAASDIKRMYSDFYTFLSSCGVDSVKTDVQFYLDQLVSAPSRRALIPAYQDAWTIAQLRHFSARAISCMSQSPSILFHSQLPTNRPSIPVRNSDDFFPEIEASHPWHIFCNAHNSLLTQHLNVVPDWDMFQTKHAWAGFHAAARCVSGGPIYFTDAPGEHDLDLIEAMTARTPQRGRRIILRPHRTGRSMSQYVAYKDQALVKVGTYVGFARTGSGILGVFNCLQSGYGEFVRLRDFPGAEDGVEYVVRSFGGEVSPVMKAEEDKSLVKVDLEVRGWAILTAHPVKTFAQKHGETKIALLGLIGKMTGIAAVLGYDVYMEDNGRVRMWVNLKAVGVLGVYVSSLKEKSVDENVMVLLGGQPLPRETVRVSKADQHVLEIDYEQLWKEDENRDVKTWTWGNEVSLEVFIS